MAYLDWSESYSVGIPKIDMQHQKLVAFLNQLYEAMQAGKGNDVLGKVLNDLAMYTKTHFSTEEQLMEQHRFPGFQAHKDTHEKMAAKVMNLKKQFNDGTISSPIQITNFLKKWLAKHIMETDQKYSPFLKSKGV